MLQDSSKISRQILRQQSWQFPVKVGKVERQAQTLTS
jgi:hypothetical protein